VTVRSEVKNARLKGGRYRGKANAGARRRQVGENFAEWWGQFLCRTYGARGVFTSCTQRFRAGL